MRLRLGQLISLVEAAAHLRQIDGDVIDLLVDDFVGAHYEGKSTLGLGNFLELDRSLSQVLGSPIIEEEFAGLTLIDGQRSLGHAAALFGVGILRSKLISNGIAAVALRNFGRYGRLKPIILRAMRKDAIVIMMNGGGPAVVSSPGGSSPLIGTNPIAIGIPCEPPFVVDTTTSHTTWAEVAAAGRNHRILERGPFFDAAGNVTTSAADTVAMIPMSGFKGFSIGLAIEIISSIVSNGPFGRDVADEYELGALMIGIHLPSLTRMFDLDGLKDKLVAQLPASYNARRRFNRQDPSQLENDVDLEQSVFDSLVSMTQPGS